MREKLDSSGIMRKGNRVPIFFLIVLFSSLFPFAFRKVGPLPNFMWIEGLAPIVFVLGVFRLIAYKRKPVQYGGIINTAAMLTLVFWAFMHFSLNPVSGRFLFDSGQSEGGIRAYYSIVIGVCLFFYFYWFSCHRDQEDGWWKRLLNYVFWISLFVGYIRMVTYLLGIEVPLLRGGLFDYASNIYEGSRTYRIGGLSEAGTLAVASLIGLYYRKRWNLRFALFLLLCLPLIIMSGGRAASFGVVAALGFYAAIIEKGKSKILKGVLLCLVLISIGLVAGQTMQLKNQVARITAVGGGFAINAPGRYEISKRMWQIFRKHPILGKGIGYEDVNVRLEPWIRTQLFSGGHGSYTSILMVFGLGGAVFLSIALYGTILRASLYLRKDRCSGVNSDYCSTICFVLVAFVILSVEFVASGNGYSNLRLYVLAGIATGIFVKTRLASKIEEGKG